MSVIALTGNDTHVVNNRILRDFADGKCFTLEYEGELGMVKKGKNGNSIYTFNYGGQIAKVTYRLVRGGPDHIFFAGLLASLEQNPPGFILLNGMSQANIGDGAGNIIGDQYILQGGIFNKKPGVEEDTEGTVDQGIVAYTLLYGSAPESLV